jgi:hypothetical protein
MRLRLLLLALSLLAACGQKAGDGTAAGDSDTASVPAPERPGTITLSDAPASPEFPDARLAILNVSAAPQGADSVKVSFGYSVAGYELKSQTGGDAAAMCANSAQGQHIHFIIDNRPYVALYEPKHETVVAKNSEHTVVSFLSRSYHESIKSRGAAIMYRFKIDGSGNLQKLGNPSSPALIYSRPKGDYLGKDTANILLDFYLFNTTLGERAKVKADVTNETTGRTASFTISEWKPSILNGLGSGKAKVTLTLLDGNGIPVEGQSVIREGIRLAAQEPMK